MDKHTIVLTKAIDRASSTLRQGTFGVLNFKYITGYGAIEIAPRYATVWIILHGDCAAMIPEYSGFRAGDSAPVFWDQDHYRSANVDADILAPLISMRDILVRVFQQAGWPGALQWIGFADARRVDIAGGGYKYFR